MAPAFGFRAVDHADEPLQPLLQERLANILAASAFAQIEQEPARAAVMA